MTVALPKMRAKLNERADRLCEIRIPGVCLGFANNAHHRLNRSQGGRDILSNLLLACGSGTTGCHGFITSNPAEARRKGWTTWSSDMPRDVPVVYRGYWSRLDDEGNVHLLPKGHVRNELGHLSIANQPGDVRGQSAQCPPCGPQEQPDQRTRIL